MRIKTSLLRIIVLFFIPYVTIILCSYFFILLIANETVSNRFLLATVVAGGISGLYCIVILINYLSKSRKAHLMKTERDDVRETLRFFETRVKELEEKLELLTAMRNVSRVVSDEVNSEDQITEIMRIIDDLLEVTEITVFRTDEREVIVPYAKKVERDFYYKNKIKDEDIENTTVYDSYKHRRLFRTIENNLLIYTVPLIAEHEIVGVLKMSVKHVGTSKEKEDKTEYTEFVIKDIAKHIALALKTTTLHSKAIIDGLTGLFNKSHFLEQLKSHFDQFQRLSQNSALIMADIDHFKQINDTYGHLMGDKILARIGSIIRKNLRRYDSAYRYGGEELSIILPQSALEQAGNFAERIRLKIESRNFKTKKGKQIPVTVSLGVAVFTHGMTTINELIHNADKALYRAKQNGRNQVCVASADSAAAKEKSV